jgi:cobalt/nickel transport system permease protein
MHLPAIPIFLHIPDGFLSTPVAAFFWVVSGIVIGMAVRQTNRTLKESTAPLMGVLAAFIFAAQMMNFPVAGGTSGHMLGGALAAILLGPWAAIIVMTSVVGIQALVFQDGGLAALGANVFNMGIATAFVGYAIYKAVAAAGRYSRPFILTGTFAAAWISVMVAALLTSLQLVISDTSELSVVLPAMLGIHALIGIGEGLISVGAVALVLSARPDLLNVAPEEPDFVGNSALSGERS